MVLTQTGKSHLIPLGIGGADTEANLWPEPRRSVEPVWNAERKDRLEWKLHDLICASQIDVATLMSKGLGHVGRAVLAAFEDEPDNAFTTEELCERAYPSTAKYLPERAQRVAVLRAVKRLTALRPDLGIRDWPSECGRGGEIVFHRKYRVLSYAMARLKADNNTPWGDSENKLRARLAPGGRDHHLVEPGGSWARHTEMEIAKRDGDHEKLAMLEAEQGQALNRITEQTKTALAKMQGEQTPNLLPNYRETDSSESETPPVTPDPASGPPQE